ncbi:hypothetical protein MLD38_023377 [Melastoma candidum]|uniref:Uncharacterized protein n=1 Tax=Melastoma candidum TaxID=119954 RepID=A0ACB9QLG2_9MYRT|nr:hypothetical protein MLD38_023377 [Melastoma candidum]
MRGLAIIRHCRGSSILSNSKGAITRRNQSEAIAPSPWVSGRNGRYVNRSLIAEVGEAPTERVEEPVTLGSGFAAVKSGVVGGLDGRDGKPLWGRSVTVAGWVRRRLLDLRASKEDGFAVGSGEDREDGLLLLPALGMPRGGGFAAGTPWGRDRDRIFLLLGPSLGPSCSPPTS